MLWKRSGNPWLAANRRERSYSVRMNGEGTEAQRRGIGLCADCRFMRVIESDRGSTFYLCERSTTDPRFPKYPRLPVLRCAGYESLNANGEPAHE